MVSAEYGGTGGKPLEGGMIVEEPDIEIGQGVSSKGPLSEFIASTFPSIHSIPPDRNISKLPSSPLLNIILTKLLYVAISKRFPTDSGGAKGPRSSHDTHEAHREQRNKRTDYNDNNQRGGRDNNIGVAPPTPGFGTGLPFPMNMMPPNMPPGFQYPGFPSQPTGR